MRALVSGYYGFDNAGDEAILAGLVEGFRAAEPAVELTVLSGNPEATRAEHGVAAAPRGFSSARARLRETDLFISGGGGLIQDATSWRSPLYYLGLIWLARRAGVPIACLGQSVGPVRRRWVRGLARRGFNRARVLAVRDRRSAEMVRSLGVSREIHVTGDLALLLPPPGPADCERAWRKAALAATGEPTAAIAVRRLPQEDRGRGREIGQAAVAACRAAELRPVLVPMQRPQDVELAEQVARAMHVGEVVHAPLTARETLALIGGFDLVIAMRLHALIMAAVCGRPLVGISYDPKVDGLMGELGLPLAATAREFSAEQVRAAVEETWRTREQVTAHLAARVERVRAQARANIDLARQALSP